MKKAKRLLALTAAFAVVMSVSVAAAPYKDHNIGEGTTTIECEDYDYDGYEETNPADGSRPYRNDDDANLCPQTESNDNASNGYTLSYVSGGEWTQYTVNVTVAGKYHLDLIAATDAGDDITVDVLVDDALVSTVPVAKTGWTAYGTYEVGTVDLTAGTHVLKLSYMNGVNTDAVVVNLVEAAAAVSSEAPKASPKTGVESTMLPLIALVLSGTALVVIRKRQAEVR